MEQEIKQNSAEQKIKQTAEQIAEGNHDININYNNPETQPGKRPISPHLTIYRLQISSALSVLHRVTGMGLFFALVIICWWLILWVFSGFNDNYLMYFNQLPIRISIFLIIYGYSYHICNGIRHLSWDTGKGFSLKSVNHSGQSAVIVSIILTLVFALVVLR